MSRGALVLSVAAVLCVVAAGLQQLPIVRRFYLAPGSTAGFEFSEENLFEFLRFSGTVDCIYYSFNSTRPMHAALWFQRWEYVRDFAANYSAPPLDESVVPGSGCMNTTYCEMNFEAGKLPLLPNPGRRRSGLNAVPYTVAFWYDLTNTEYTNVTLVVDAPCYTGELETIYFPAEPVATNNTETNNTQSG